MADKVEVTKILLNVGGKEIPLTVAQCKKLKELLGEMFGKEVIVEERHHYHDNWYPRWYYYPQVTWPGSGVVYCSNSELQDGTSLTNGTLMLDVGGTTC